MAYGVQYGAKYTVTGSDGTVAVINDQTDPNFIGQFDAAGGNAPITGLSGYEIVESADDLTEMDGGVHGKFYRGRRPITLQPIIVPVTSVSDQSAKLQRFQRATTGLRQRYPNDTSNGDITLSWLPQGSPDPLGMYLKARTQQPFREQGAFIKTAYAGLVAADPRIYGLTAQTQTLTAAGTPGAAGRSYDRSYNINFDWGSTVATGTLTNSGDGIAPVVLTINGPGTNFAVQNVTTGEEISIAFTLQTGEQLIVDTLKRSILYVNTGGVSVSKDGALSVPRSLWWGLLPGSNSINFLVYSGQTNGTTSVKVDWRYTWI